MGTFRFGTHEELTCITDVPLKGPGGDALCLAYKTSTHYFLAGVYVSDDGYVLKSKVRNDAYFPLDAGKIQTHQATGEFPTPMPGYSLSFGTYFLGYSLWIALAVVLIIELVRRLAAKRRKVELDALRATTAPSLGPPALRTKADHFVAQQIGPLLRPHERVLHQAYGIDRAQDGSIKTALEETAYFVVLTSERMLFVKTRVGAFGVLRENQGVEWIERNAVLRVVADDRLLQFWIAGGAVKTVYVHPTRALSNQQEFLRDVPRLLVAPQGQGSPTNNPFTPRAYPAA